MAPGLGGMAFYTCKQFMHLKVFTSNEKAILGYLLFMKFKKTDLFHMFHAKHCKFANILV
jgi:hypothetical protein